MSAPLRTSDAPPTDPRPAHVSGNDVQDRRSFLLALAALTAGCVAARSSIEPGAAQAAIQPVRLPPIGLQLYTVRALLARDFEGTLGRLAAIGYRELEFAGYHGRPAAAVRSSLERFALTAPSAHVPLERLRDDWEAVLTEARVVGHRWITLPWVQARGWTAADWQQIARLLNARGAEAAQHGLRMAYHNHDFELRGSPLPLDVLMHETDPALVDFELDVYWLVRAGQDPSAWLTRHPGRVRLLHVKDTAGAPEHRMVDVGAGTIDFATLLPRATEAGVRHAFVEHDNPADPLASVRASHAHLAGLRTRGST